MIKIEHQEPGLTESLYYWKVGELGLLGLAIPEEYGSMGKDFNTNSIIGRAYGKIQIISFIVRRHIGIGITNCIFW